MFKTRAAVISVCIVLASVALVPIAAESAGPAYPIKVSPNGRYLLDQNNVPFLIVGDAPHDLINTISLEDAEQYLANRQTYGVNSLWVELVCNWYTNCNSDGTTYDGIAPFLVSGDVTTPNPAYFAKVDAVLNLAASHGMNVFLDPTETGGWLSIFEANGTEKMYAYGQYLGTRYKNFPNIIWIHGNDFQSWQDPSDNDLILAVANGIRSADPNHLQTLQLNFNTSHSLQDSSWTGILGMNGVYTYYPIYAETYKAYNESTTMPVFLEEANYEGENNTGMDPSTTEVLRRQEYWSILAGALGGHMFGTRLWAFPPGWQDDLDSPGVGQLKIMKEFFTSYAWYNLVPDQDHSLVTAGYGTYADSGPIHTNDYVTAAVTGDGSLAMAYLPTTGTITVAMSRLAGPAVARWFDPSNGAYSMIGTFANTGTQQFTPTGPNQDGDGDWVLTFSLIGKRRGQVTSQD